MPTHTLSITRTPPDQTGLRMEYRQQMERRVQNDIESGRVKTFKDAKEALTYLGNVETENDAVD